MPTTSPLPHPTPRPVRALYSCSLPELRHAVQHVIADLPILDGQAWHLSMPTPDAATVWHPARRSTTSYAAGDLPLYLAGAPHASQVWSVVTTPATVLLFGVLSARLSEHLRTSSSAVHRGRSGRPSGSSRWSATPGREGRW